MSGIVYGGKFEQIINEMLGPQNIAASAMKLKIWKNKMGLLVLGSS